MEQFKTFLKGFGVILLFMMIAISGIIAVIYSPYIIFKVFGVVTIIVSFHEIITKLKQGIN